MSTNDMIDARPESVSSLITFSSNSAPIIIPVYQRSYQWDPSRVLDILKLSDPDNASFGFIGTMVFVKNANVGLEVVDGQQRLISIVLALCAFRDILAELISDSTDDKIKKMLEDMRRDIQKENLLDSKSYAASDENPRITFQRSTYETFKQVYLLGDITYQSEDEVVKTELNTFKKNYEHAREYLRIKYPRPTKNIVSLLNLRLEKLKGLMVNAIYISDPKYAGEVFESINGTGVNLKLSELVKNFIFRNVSLISAETKWEEIQANCNNRNDYIEKVIKYDWQNRYDLTDDYEIFRSIRSNITEVDRYLDRLLRNSRIFSFYLNPSAEKFKFLKIEDNSNDKNHVVKQAAVLRMLKVIQYLRVIIALDGLREFTDIKKLLKLLDLIVHFQVRAKVTGIGPNYIDALYSSVGKNLQRLQEEIGDGNVPKEKAKERIDTEIFDKLMNSFKKLSQNEDFIESFAKYTRTKSSNKDMFKYMLSTIENHLQNKELVIDINDNHVTLEEIYPQTPSNEWAATDCTPEDIYKIANATILTDADNKKASNNLVMKKHVIYRESNLKINKELTSLIEDNNLSWNKSMIHLRGKQLALYASDIWKL